MPRRKAAPADLNENKIIDISTMNPVDKKQIPMICRKIRYYREKLGIEQKELGSRLNIVGNAVCNWENGRSRPDINLIPDLCDALGITLYDLFDIDDPVHKQSEREKNLLSHYRKLSEEHKYLIDDIIHSIEHIETVKVCPEIKELIYFDRSLAAGIGDPTEFDEDGEPIYIYSSPAVEQADCVFSVNGDSMEPKYHNEDMVLVQRYPKCPNPRPGEIGAFIVGNETYIKEYREDGLHSLNSDYSTMHFNGEEQVYFIGKVVGILDPDNDIATDTDVSKYFSVYKKKL